MSIEKFHDSYYAQLESITSWPALLPRHGRSTLKGRS